MNNFLEGLKNGQFDILIWFLIAVVLIYIPIMYIWWKKKKRKSLDFESTHPNAVKVFIERTSMNDLLTVYHVNGEKPTMHSKGIKYGFYLLPGRNTIGVVYQWTTMSITSVSGYETHEAESKEMDVMVRQGKAYSICFNHNLSEYVFTEI